MPYQGKKMRLGEEVKGYRHQQSTDLDIPQLFDRGGEVKLLGLQVPERV